MAQRKGEDIFCKMVAGEMETEKVYEDDWAIGLKDINPAAPTHVLVVPKEHVVNLFDAGDDDAELMGRLLLAARNVAREQGLEDQGFRLVINNGAGVGQSVFHIHLHVLGGRAFSWPPG